MKYIEKAISTLFIVTLMVIPGFFLLLFIARDLAGTDCRQDEEAK